MIRKTRDWAKEIPLLHQQGKIYQFYNSKEFQRMRNYILHKHHYECLECKRVGRYTRATVVHHVIHVEDRPDLCLSEYYKDEYGIKHMQLEPVCASCHNMLHPEKSFKNQSKADDQFANDERW